MWLIDRAKSQGSQNRDHEHGCAGQKPGTNVARPDSLCSQEIRHPRRQVAQIFECVFPQLSFRRYRAERETIFIDVAITTVDTDIEARFKTARELRQCVLNSNVLNGVAVFDRIAVVPDFWSFDIPHRPTSNFTERSCFDVVPTIAKYCGRAVAAGLPAAIVPLMPISTAMRP